MMQKAEDVGNQSPDAAKAARADNLGGDFAKEAFHQIKPGGRGRNKMEVKTGVTLEPGRDPGVLVGGIIVANNVKLKLGGDLPIDLAQEGKPLLMAMSRGGVGKHLARKIVQGSKEGYRPMSVVVVGLGANVSLAQRQTGLGAFEGLTLALFITEQSTKARSGGSR